MHLSANFSVQMHDLDITLSHPLGYIACFIYLSAHYAL